MKNKKFQKLSIAALIATLLPLATFIPVLFKITLSPLAGSTWAGVNIVCVLLGLVLSIVSIKNKESRSIINITSTIISCLWLLVMAGIVVLALFINFL